ncbi:hypothetical protein DIPPA_22627 [Diplonema papillatum]|nr:hypothetical protein DIPPA_22627 [Diplonema papillatum]
MSGKRAVTYGELRDELLRAGAYETLPREALTEYVDCVYRKEVPFMMYGYSTKVFEDSGCQLLGRMLVETKLDHYAVRAKAVLSEILGSPDLMRRPTGLTVIDPFAGAGNLLYHVCQMRVSPASAFGPSDRVPVQGIGFELDAAVFDIAEQNFKSFGPDEVRPILHNADCLTADLSGVPPDDHVVVLVDPPWAESGYETGRMELAKTKPPVPDVIRSYCRKLAGHCRDHRLYFVIPCPLHTVVGDLFESLLYPLAPREIIEHTPAIRMLLMVGVARPELADSDS